MTLPNLISIFRIMLAPVLGLLIAWKQEQWFAWTLAFALLTDAVDGFLARILRQQSKLGARLDSAGDLLIYLVAIAGICFFHSEIVRIYILPIMMVAGMYGGQVVLALWRYGQFSSFHTILSKVAAVLQSAFVLALFFLGFWKWLFYTAIAVSCIAYLEEVVLVFIFTRPKTNVKGLWWVIRNSRM